MFCILVSLCFANGCATMCDSGHPLAAPLGCSLIPDHHNFYSVEALVPLAAGFAAGGVMANTQFDEEFRQEWQDNIHGETIDDVARGWRFLGEGPMAAVAVTAYAAGTYAPDAYGADVSREWGERSLRAIVVGAPPLVASQFLTGGSRPGESASGSEWSPFSDANGVSGHTFMAAVPLITAAQMADDPYLKSAFYAASTMTGLARIHEDAHYSSQVMLGWLIAYVASDAVSFTEEEQRWCTIAPSVVGGGLGMAVSAEY